MNSKVLMVLTGMAGVIQSIYYYTQFPEKVASHFGSSGIPDGWMPRLENLFVSSAIFVFMTIMMFSLPRLVSILPVRFVNLPNRDYWLANERKEQTIKDLTVRMFIFGSAINIFFIFVTHMVFEANNVQPVKLNENNMLLALGIFMLFLAGWLISFIRRFRKTAQPN